MNAEFTRAVARAVRRPAILPVPSILLRLVLGPMSSMLLDSSRVRPAVALACSYHYLKPTIHFALEASTRP